MQVTSVGCLSDSWARKNAGRKIAWQVRDIIMAMTAKPAPPSLRWKSRLTAI